MTAKPCATGWQNAEPRPSSHRARTRKWRKDGEDSDRFSTEILLVPGGRVQFLDKPNGNGAPAMNGKTVPAAETAATVVDSEIP